MSRFSGPQYIGALRDLRVVRRAEAEARQAEEAERDRQRKAECAVMEPAGIDAIALRDLLLAVAELDRAEILRFFRPVTAGAA